jgi:hypothetical protein
MTQPTFVRYSPEVEREEPTFEESLQRVVEQTKQSVAASLEAEGIGRAVRDAHAKAYGLVRTEVEILAGLPPAYAQGVYATPGRHEALIRFSAGAPHVGPDWVMGATTGMGLKIFGIESPVLLEDEPDGGTMDYANINAPIFFATSVKHYEFIQKIFLEVGKTPPQVPTRAQVRAAQHRLFTGFLTGLGTLPQEEWAWDELLAFLSLTRNKPTNLLLSTYWTMGAVRHGDYIAKVSMAPVPAYADRVVRREMTLTPVIPEVYRPALVDELRERPFEFDLRVQLCTDLEMMPVEDPTVEWSEALSPPLTVAKLRLPQQDIGDDKNLELADAVSITLWRCPEAHRPLGNIQRARKEVYRQASIVRHQLNHQVRREPKNLAEVFGESVAMGSSRS